MWSPFFSLSWPDVSCTFFDSLIFSLDHRLLLFFSPTPEFLYINDTDLHTHETKVTDILSINTIPPCMPTAHEERKVGGQDWSPGPTGGKPCMRHLVMKSDSSSACALPFWQRACQLHHHVVCLKSLTSQHFKPNLIKSSWEVSIIQPKINFPFL